MRQTPNSERQPVKIAGGSTFGRYPKISSAKTYNMFVSDNWLINTGGYQRIYDLLPQLLFLFLSLFLFTIQLLIANYFRHKALADFATSLKISDC